MARRKGVEEAPGEGEHMMMRPPAALEGASVICWSPIDERHTFIGKKRPVVHGQAIGPVSRLAGYSYPRVDGAYPFRCDAAWATTTDTWHATIDDALRQAEFECLGVVATWVCVRQG